MNEPKNTIWGDWVCTHIWRYFAGSFADAAEQSGIPQEHLERMAAGEGPGEYGDRLLSIGIDPVIWDLLTQYADRGSYGCQYTITGELAGP